MDHRPSALMVSAAAAALALCAGGACAADVEGELTLASAYVWRGMTFTDGAVLQPAVTISGGSGLSANLWGNLDLADVNGMAGELQEVDLTVSYAIPTASALGVEVGYIEYRFPHGGPATREAYLSVGLDLAVDPYLALYYDFGEIDDAYGQIGLSWQREIAPEVALEASAWAGYAGAGFAAAGAGTGSGWYDGNASLTVTWDLGDALALAGFVQYVTSLDARVLPPGRGGAAGHDVDWLAGLTLTISP